MSLKYMYDINCGQRGARAIEIEIYVNLLQYPSFVMFISFLTFSLFFSTHYFSIVIFWIVKIVRILSAR